MPEYLVRAAFRSHDSASLALCVNVFHVVVDAFTSPPNYTKISSDIDAWLGQAWRDVNADTYTVDDLTVTSIDIPGQPLGQGVHSYGFVGTRPTSDHNLSAGLCRVTSWKTATPKRYARGRTFWPPAVSEVETSPGGGWNLVGTYITTTSAFTVAFATPHNSGDDTYSAAVYSPHQLALGNSKPYYPIISATSDNHQHFLRSRVTSP